MAATLTSPSDSSTHADAEGDAAAIVFPFAFEPAFRIAGLALGITPSHTAVTITAERFEARFGFWRVSTPLANILAARVTGPYQPLKVLGGPRVSLGDRGLTFATNARQGVCITFVEPVTGIDPAGAVHHPGLTVTVAEPAALAELLDRAGHEHATSGGPVSLETLQDEVDDDLLALTAAQLRARVRDLGLSGVGKLRKAELIELLRTPDARPT